MILDNDESDEAGTEDKAEDAASELASRPTKSIDTSGPWYDVEEECWIDEPTPRLGSCEPQGVPPTPTQDQPHTLHQSSRPSQDQINQQDISDIAQSTSVESAPHSLPRPSDNGDAGWTEDSMAELEREVGLALVAQVMSSPASVPNSPRPPRSVEAPQDEGQSQDRSETTGSRPEEPRDASRPGTPAQGLEEREQRETRVV